LPAVAALVDAVIGAGKDGARLARMHGQPKDPAFAPQPALDALPAVAAIGAEPGAAADRADTDRIIRAHRQPPCFTGLPSLRGSRRPLRCLPTVRKIASLALSPLIVRSARRARLERRTSSRPVSRCLPSRSAKYR